MEKVSDELKNVIEKRIESICNQFSQSQEYKDAESKIIQQRKHLTINLDAEIVRQIFEYENSCLKIQDMTNTKLYIKAYEDGAKGKFEMTPRLTPD
jgi:hypothetical protein